MKINTEEAILKLMETQDGKELVKNCYYDFNALTAYERFLSSEEWKALTKLIKIFKIPDKKVLDIGAGNGISSYAFFRSGYQVYSIEFDSSELVGFGALRKIKEEHNYPIYQISAVGEAIPLRENSFGLVYLRQVLHHALDLNQFLLEISRVLAPGGIFIATREHIVDNEKGLMEFRDHHPLHKMTDTENAYTLGQYLSAVKNSGMRIEKVLLSEETVINHFPKSDVEIQQKITRRLNRKIGSLGKYVLRCPGIERYLRRRLSLENKTPGRMISLIAKKPKAVN